MNEFHHAKLCLKIFLLCVRSFESHPSGLRRFPLIGKFQFRFFCVCVCYFCRVCALLFCCFPQFLNSRKCTARLFSFFCCCFFLSVKCVKMSRNTRGRIKNEGKNGFFSSFSHGHHLFFLKKTLAVYFSFFVLLKPRGTNLKFWKC